MDNINDSHGVLYLLLFTLYLITFLSSRHFNWLKICKNNDLMLIYYNLAAVEMTMNGLFYL